MAIPVSVVCDRGAGGGGALDLTPRIAEGTLDWSTVVPGGFASCGFQLDGDFRRTLKDIPYLSTIRIIGDTGSVLWEGQVEDLTPILSENSVGLKVTAMGLQNVLKETSVRAIWSKRDIAWTVLPDGYTIPGSYTQSAAVSVQTGQYDPTDISKSGVNCIAASAGASLANSSGGFARYMIPIGLNIVKWIGLQDLTGTDTGTTKFQAVWLSLEAGTWQVKAASAIAGTGVGFSITPSSPTALITGAVNTSGGAVALAANDFLSEYTHRLLGVLSGEDTAGGFYGDTLINSLLTSYVPELGAGVIESGSDFLIDHLDASVRRNAADILNEIASYYQREWAVWENALLDWTTPNLSQPQWIIPIANLESLDLDASVVNAQKTSIILYTDAASGLTAEQSSASTDRRNPYVLNGRTKDKLVDMGAMTSNTAQQLATVLLKELGFGPVPAAGTITLPGETIVQHAQGNAAKAWELRAGDNVTIPELPLADIFTQDGRGECLFHIVATEAETSRGMVTLTLDSYGSKRSDVLMARIAAVTQLLGG